MSTHIIGIRPPDARWQQMKAIWDACQAAGVEVPESVGDYFEGENPDSAGVRVEIEDTPAVTEWNDDSASGFEVDIRALPSDVTIIRFYNSW